MIWQNDRRMQHERKRSFHYDENSLKVIRGIGVTTNLRKNGKFSQDGIIYNKLYFISPE